MAFIKDSVTKTPEFRWNSGVFLELFLLAASTRISFHKQDEYPSTIYTINPATRERFCAYFHDIFQSLFLWLTCAAKFHIIMIREKMSRLTAGHSQAMLSIIKKEGNNA